MPFLGNRPAENYISYDVQHFTTSATTNYTLDHAVTNENELRLVINNVVQQPGSSYAYSASGTSLTLTSATSATDTMYCVYLGKARSTVTPASGSVTNAMLGETITVANGGTGLTSGFKNGITEIDMWRLTTSYSYTGGQSYVDLTSNWERTDTDGFSRIGTGMSESSGIFSFPSTGIYLITFNTHAETSTNNARFVGGAIRTTLDNSSFSEATEIQGNALASTMGQGTRTTVTAQFIFDVTDITTHKVKFAVASNQNSTSYLGDTNSNTTFASFVRLGDT